MAAKYHCNYCDGEIQDLKVRCSECPNLDLCLMCFSCGAEIGGHRRKHSYQLIDCGTFSIFQDSGWKAMEEMALLEAVELFGFGNWGDIGNVIGSKDAQQVKSHFIHFYVHGNLGRIPWALIQESSSSSTVEGSPLCPSITQPLPEIGPLSGQEEVVLGYMPKRDDFEREFDNDAESLISNLFLNPSEDEDIEMDLKVAQIDMYKRRLEERFRRKSIARDHNLVANFYASHPLPSPSSSPYPNLRDSKKMESEEPPWAPLEERLRPFCQLGSKGEWDGLVRDLKREKWLKSRIKELIRSRRNGIMQYEEMKFLQGPGGGGKKKGNSGSDPIPSSGPKSSMDLVEVEEVEVEVVGKTSPRISRKQKEKGWDGMRWGKKFDANSLPSSRLLSSNEKILCNSIRLRPSQYLTLKTLILKEYHQKKVKSRSSLETVDRVICRKVTNFMRKNGWIPS